MAVTNRLFYGTGDKSGFGIGGISLAKINMGDQSTTLVDYDKSEDGDSF